MPPEKTTRLFLGVGFLSMIALTIVLGIGAIKISTNLTEVNADLYRHPFVVSNTLRDIKWDIIEIHRDMKDIVLFRHLPEIDLAVGEIDRDEQRAYERFDIVLERFLGNKIRVEEARQTFSDWKPIRAEVVQLVQAGRHREAAAITAGKGAKHVASIVEKIDELIAFAHSKAAEFNAKSNAEHDSNMLFLFGLIASVVISGGSIAVFVIVKVNKTERNFAESEERFRALFDHAPYAVNIKDRDGKIVRMNPETRKWHGLTEHASGNLKITDLIKGPLGEWVSGKDQEVFETGLSVSYQQEVTKSDGSTFPALILKFPILDDLGQVALVGTMATDISDRVAVEEALKASEVRLRAIMDNTPAAISLKGSDGRFLSANRFASARYGLNTEEFVGKSTEDLDGPEIAREVAEQEQLVRNSGSAKTFEVTRNLGGEERTLMIVRFPVQVEHGEYLGIGSVHLDITERKKAEQELRESEERFSTAFQWNPVALCITRMEDGSHIYVNDRWLLELGHTRDEVIGHSAVELGVWADPPEREVFVERLKRKGSAHDFNALFVTKDGAEKTVVVEGKLIEIDGKQRVLMAFRDVTAHNQMERQLLQAQKMETVGQLTGGVAHDFNNLLQVVQGNLEMAKDTIQKGSRAEELVNGALRAGHRGAKLTQQLLAFSRKQTLRPENLDAHSLVNGMTSLLARTLGEDISIETQIADGIANVIVDENGLTNALLNLALNARAAMPTGGTLTVTVNKLHFDTDIPIENDVLPTGDYIEIAVSDTGAGMSVETLDHAFEPFFTTKEVGEGSGLGLSMVYGFARQSGGNATIESKSGKGTTVRLVLPAATGATSSTNEAQAVGKDAQHAIKVLLVEDDADVRATTLMVLKSLGCEVVEAENAVPVLDILLRDDSIDLLLSDIVLPGGKNGIDLAQEAVRQHPALKVILVSGYPEGTLEKAGLKEAGFRLLSKPFSKNALSETLASVMAH